MGPDGDLVAPRLNRGCRCFAVWIDGAVAGYGWLSTGREWIGELQLEITPNANEGYIWDCATVVEHRRKGIFRSLLVGISRAAHREGMKRLWIGTIAVPAEKVLAQSGFRPALHFASARLGGWHLMRVGAASDANLVAAAHAALKTRSQLLVRRSRSRAH
jgi:GNAT superfamily N-acetyltransferase